MIKIDFRKEGRKQKKTSEGCSGLQTEVKVKGDKAVPLYPFPPQSSPA